MVQRVKFSRQGDFRQTLTERIDAYFDQPGRHRRGAGAMYRKTGIILAWFVLSYMLLVFTPMIVAGKVAAAISLGLAGAAIGTSIMHDAGHGSYSGSPLINRILFFSLDLLGGSSYVWRYKHNTLHHTYTNIEGHDDDLEVGWLGRLAEGQRHLPFHGFQHIYLWVLYGFIGIKWFFFDDFACLIRGKIGDQTMPRPPSGELVALLFGKLFFFAIAFVIPAFFHPLWAVLTFYVLASFSLGLALAVTFQLAHCVEEADFPRIPEDQRMAHDWATHQVLTTVNFAPGNRLLSWYVGGLNYQIEHHLFPKVSHVHYPHIAPIVARTCAEFGIPYRVQPTLLGGIRSHYRYLRRLGRPFVSNDRVGLQQADN
jgi:linoleoyl-CoA desaturase